ncbi:4-Cys prefix domain-containing protein [Microseira sp. BLCC-F43]|jgi:serine/threonine protein kinase|uniref:4-Cys prefix domain-containing protein n=1 Tax=Microseira sp. BLCC-F43 TaxID=3153602 RepID=UPI0035B94710
MNYCVTPGCLHPQNPDNAKFCHSCGAKLLLLDRYRPIQTIGRGGFGRTFLGVDEHIPSKPRCVIKQLYLQTQGSLGLKKATQLFHQEAQRLDELGQHRQIPTLLAHFEQQKQLYLVQ